MKNSLIHDLYWLLRKRYSWFNNWRNLRTAKLYARQQKEELRATKKKELLIAKNYRLLNKGYQERLVDLMRYKPSKNIPKNDSSDPS